MFKCFSRFALSSLVVLGFFNGGGLGGSCVQADEPATKAPETQAKPAPAPRDRAALEKDFESQMSGSVFIGRFTVVGKEDQAPKEERYTITKVKKQPNGKWIFVSRIQYGKNDVQIPMELDVEWAGDTPVITLTDLTIPGLGTFTSRVLVYRGWYSGTWLHGEVGGHLFGRIEKLATDKKPTESKKSEKDDSSKTSDTKTPEVKEPEVKSKEPKANGKSEKQEDKKESSK